MVTVDRSGLVRPSRKVGIISYEPRESYIDPTLERLGLDLSPTGTQDPRDTINDLVASVRHASEQGPDKKEPDVARRREIVDLRRLEDIARNYRESPATTEGTPPYSGVATCHLEQALASVGPMRDKISEAKLVDMLRCCNVRVIGSSLETELRVVPQDSTEEGVSNQRTALLLRNLALGTVIERAATATNPIERIAAARVAASQPHLEEARQALMKVFTTDPEPAVIHAVAKQIHSVAAIKDPNVRDFVIELFEAGQKHLEELKGRLGEFTQKTDPSKFRYHFRCIEASAALLATRTRAADGSSMGGYS